MTETAQRTDRVCLVSGANGYLGSRIGARLRAAGWQVRKLVRQPGADGAHFALGEAPRPDVLAGAQALIHCAYDFSKVAWREIHEANVRGSELLFEAARSAGITRLVTISSISAFTGCHSFYGRAKLEIEALTFAYGGWAIRPGLVYGEAAAAVFGQLIKNVTRSRILPLPGGGYQLMYLVHESDLAEAVLAALDPARSPIASPVTVAHEQAWRFRDILQEIARSRERKLTLVPIPWHLIWIGLRAAEVLRVPTGLRSDSLVSLMHQNPRPLINVREALGVACRPFALAGVPA